MGDPIRGGPRQAPRRRPERENVLVIRVTRPAGLDYRASNFTEAAAKGERYAALQKVAVETADGFIEELSAAWEAVQPIVAEVLAGRRMFDGRTLPLGRHGPKRDG